VQARNFGNPALPGGQAEYFRMPLADTSLFHLPTDLPMELLINMTDILPTGYSVAMNARRLADEERTPTGPQDALVGKLAKRGVCVVVGCGPVSTGRLKHIATNTFIPLS
jgi:threonine dehydrogenase-like Zn-dependent dehydrogenase